MATYSSLEIDKSYGPTLLRSTGLLAGGAEGQLVLGTIAPSSALSLEEDCATELTTLELLELTTGAALLEVTATDDEDGATDDELTTLSELDSTCALLEDS